MTIRSERAAWINEAMDTLRGYWLEHPNLRLGQLVVNAANVQQIPAYEMSDGQFFYGLGLVEGAEQRRKSGD